MYNDDNFKLLMTCWNQLSKTASVLWFPDLIILSSPKKSRVKGGICMHHYITNPQLT